MQVVSRTNVGMVRTNNEDSFLVREPYLFVVADGMGGCAAGEIASRATLKAFEAATHELREGYEGDASGVLKDAFVKANEHVFKMAVSNEAYTGMGTTMTALYLQGDNTAYVAHIGDSRMYLYRHGVLMQVTQDHTYVTKLLEEHKITRQEAQIHPKRHMLMRAIGVEESIDFDVIPFTVEEGDRLLLCTDGLTDMLTEMEITTLMEGEDLEAVGDSLIEKALDNGGRDNVTIVLVDITAGEEVGSDDISEQPAAE